MEPFTEYTSPIFTELNFDEVAHFRYFLPNDPVLESLEQTGQKDEYFLIKSVNPNGSNVITQSASAFLYVFMLFLLLSSTWFD